MADQAVFQPAPAAMHPATLQQRLKIGKPVGQGAYAIVYKATLDGRVVALKVLLPQHCHRSRGGPGTAQWMFREEGTLLKDNPHPHLLSCLEILELPPGFPGLMAGYLSNTWALVLEFMEVGSLAHLMHNQLLTPWVLAYTNEVALGWTVDVARALAHLHTLNPQVLHRDIKLENVMLCKGPGGTGRTIAKLGDLGLHTCPKRLERCKRQRLLRAPLSVCSRASSVPPSTASTRLGTGQSTTSAWSIARPYSTGSRVLVKNLFYTIREGSHTPRAINIGGFGINKPYQLLQQPPESPRRGARQFIKAPPLIADRAAAFPAPAADAAAAASADAMGTSGGEGRGDRLGLVSAPALMVRSAAPSMQRTTFSGSLFQSSSNAACVSVAPTSAASSDSIDACSFDASGTHIVPAQRGGADVLVVRPSSAASLIDDPTVSAPAGRRAERTVGWDKRPVSWDEHDQSPKRGGAAHVTPIELFSIAQSPKAAAAAAAAAAAPVGQTAGGAANAATGSTQAAATVAGIQGGHPGHARRAALQGHKLAVAFRPPPLDLGLLPETAVTAPVSASMVSPTILSPAGGPLSSRSPISASSLPPPAFKTTPTSRRLDTAASRIQRAATALPAAEVAERGATGAGGGAGFAAGGPPPMTAATRTGALTASEYAYVDLADLPALRIEDMSEVYLLTGETGSSMYIAPEVFKNEPYNDRADVFSFGVLTYEVWCRTLLNAAYIGTICTDLDRVLNTCDEYAKLVAQGFRPKRTALIPEAIWDLITACWDQDPVARPSMVQVRDRLEEILAEVEAGDCSTIASASGAPGGGGPTACGCAIN